MPFVLDASTTVAWAYMDEDHPGAALALKRMRSDAAIVPLIWWFEVRSSLLASERQKRISQQSIAEFLGHLARLPISIEGLPDESSVLATARRYRITFYDAAYLELAQRKRAALATMDRVLASAARAAGVATVGD